MTYEAEKFTKKKFPIILFAVTKAVNLISLNSVSLLYVWSYECWWWEGLHSVGLPKRPPKKIFPD